MKTFLKVKFKPGGNLFISSIDNDIDKYGYVKSQDTAMDFGDIQWLTITLIMAKLLENKRVIEITVVKA